MAHNAPEDGTAAEKRGHELFDLDVRYLGWFSVGIVILLIVTAWAAFLLMGGFRFANAVTAKQSTEGSATGPFATLQDTPQDDLRSYRHTKTAALEGYHWIDRSSGVIRIPIERAMELVVQDASARAAAPLPKPAAPPLKPAAPAAAVQARGPKP
ncbi:MAG TPA: hypothetical protein VKG05_08145 [Steroidobacteraceae bacterium]|nr:hypothetical protein [Steroidobacteraceae bacterium]